MAEVGDIRHPSSSFLGAAITLCRYDEQDAAQEQFIKFEGMYNNVGKEAQTADTDVVQQRHLLAEALRSKGS